MARGRNPSYPRRQKRCWCGSGKKEKNCHPRRAIAQVPPNSTGSHLVEVTQKPQVTLSPWGVPGEEHKIVVAPVFKGNAPPSPADIRGQAGKYRVQLLLARPGYPLRKEREHKFIDDIVGTSHIKMVKPESERGTNDADRIVLQLLGKNYQIIGIADKEGFLGKFVCELDAENNEAAEAELYGSLAPFLSAWSMNVDIPLHVETIQVTNLTTHVSFLRAVTPHFEMNFGADCSRSFSTNSANMPVFIERD